MSTADLGFVLRVIVDQFVNVRKHGTLAALVHLLCGRTRAAGSDEGIARLLAGLKGVDDAAMCDAVQALRVPMREQTPASNLTVEDMLPLLEWAEQHKAAETARHIVEMALKEDDIRTMDRAMAVWRLKLKGGQKRSRD